MMRKVSAIPPAHASLSPMKPHFAVLKPTRFRAGQLTIPLTVSNALFLPVFALINRLRAGRDGHARRNDHRKSKNKFFHFATPIATGAHNASINFPAQEQHGPSALKWALTACCIEFISGPILRPHHAANAR